jgi:hypothetical protein
MSNLSLKKGLIVLAHAFIGWALCGATMGVGSAVTSVENALIIHAVLAPVFFAVVTLVYQKKFHYTSPLATAVIFVMFVTVMDAGLVAPVFEKSFEMFASVLGTWLPFLLIFLATYVTGIIATRRF